MASLAGRAAFGKSFRYSTHTNLFVLTQLYSCAEADSRIARTNFVAVIVSIRIPVRSSALHDFRMRRVGARAMSTAAFGTTRPASAARSHRPTNSLRCGILELCTKDNVCNGCAP